MNIKLFFQYDPDNWRIILFNKLELLWCPGSWFRPREWVWGRDYSCHEVDGCLIMHCGWWGFTILRGPCYYYLISRRDFWF